MGWETLALTAFSAVSANSQMNQGKSAAKAAVQQGEYETQQTADNTLRTAGKLQTSFLQSGLTLAGGPMDILMQAYGKGTTDIGRIASNANATAKNDINAARSKALAGLAQGAAGMSMLSGVGDFASDFSTGFNNAATIQTGATPGFAPSSWVAPWQADAPLPWSNA